MSTPRGRSGAKQRDYFFTVLFVDPVAIPITDALSRTRVSPNSVSLFAILLGLPVAFLFASAERWGLIAGAALWYLSFLFDCVDGKLARSTGATSERGRRLDDLGDGARRASSVIGIVAYLWKTDGHVEAFVAVIFGVLAFYVIELSGGEMSGPAREPSGGAGRWLARYRLLPNPGMTDVSAIAFAFGPLTGWVFESIIAALVLTVAALLRMVVKVLRA